MRKRSEGGGVVVEEVVGSMGRAVERVLYAMRRILRNGV